MMMSCLLKHSADENQLLEESSMNKFDPKKIKFGKDSIIRMDTIEAKRTKVVRSITKWLEYLATENTYKNDDPKRVIPTWLSRQEGDKRHFRLKFAQRSLALTPKGEDRLTVDLDVDQAEVFEYLKQQVLSGAYDKSIEVISAEIRKGYSK